MMPVGKVSSATGIGSGHTFSRDLGAEAAATLAQYAPVPVTLQPSTNSVSPRPTDGRATAPFLAHLIATAQGAPQTRARRRTDPNGAIATYGAMMQSPAPAGRAVQESR
jgi:hypothetical protein